MAKDKSTEKSAASDQNGGERQFSIQRIYIKDASFESPQSPAIFSHAQFQPEVGIQLNTDAKTLEEGKSYEVVLTVTIEAKQEGNPVYLVEVQQSGIFAASGFDQQELGQMLGSFCPNILFPYAREAISDLVGKGGFPQLLIAPVNFDALYAQHMQARQAKGDKEVQH